MARRGAQPAGTPAATQAATQAATPATADRITAAVVGVDAAWRQAELWWGVGRLVELVSDATRLRLRAGMLRWQAAITANDARQVEALAPLVIAALAWMHVEATQAGHQKLSPVVWEAARDDGTVVAVCRTGAEASAVAREGRALEVWSLAEVVRCLPRGIGTVLATFPGARVGRATQRDEGEAGAWVTADPVTGEWQ